MWIWLVLILLFVVPACVIVAASLIAARQNAQVEELLARHQADQAKAVRAAQHRYDVMGDASEDADGELDGGGENGEVERKRELELT